MSFEISDTGTPLTEKQVERVERELDVKLPEDYRNFLLRHNGGRPRPDFFAIMGHKTLLSGRVEQLFGVGRPAKESNVDWHYKNLIGQLPNYHFPIAAANDGDMVTLSLGKLDADGSTIGSAPNIMSRGDNEAYFVAGSFDKFLASLYAVS